ncbi:nuclear transport factor 2 family protein [Sphingobium sp. AP49]|uniref:nuclear transport factor 2 family protein n=1 Tax=Sphingobium sp. AP49 TaxID=1144307 RepID=UPI00026ED0FE|nr:nuclear transport factor 2 family protein [Sphingobium sp. AP49]WHO37304.1 nuclear transport factor 2 family protein [Sphingobium sp. AP49]
MTAPRDPAADRQTIHEALHLYARAVDRLDVALGQGLWHDDGTADYGDYYRGPGRGVIDRICADHAGLQAHCHQMTNILVALEGDRAGSETYCIATLRLQRPDGLVQMSVWTRYVDRWSWRAGRWAMDHRIALREFDEVRRVQPLSAGGMGRRDREDPSYAVLARLAQSQ